MKRIVTYALLCLMLFATACGNKDKDVAVVGSNENGMVDIYYPKDYQVVKKDKQYQIKQPDSLTASIEELMAQLKEYFSEDMEYHTYMIDGDNNVSLQFVSSDEVGTEYFLLAKAAITETLFQLEDINSITITIVDEQGNTISQNLYLPGSFYFYDYAEKEHLNDVEVSLYLATAGGDKLYSESMVISLKNNTTIEEMIVEELADRGAIPKDTEINSVSISQGICYLDLSEEFQDGVRGVKKEIVLYSLVNSITSISGIDKVHISIDGETIDKYGDTIDISSPLQFSKELLR